MGWNCVTDGWGQVQPMGKAFQLKLEVIFEDEDPDECHIGTTIKSVWGQGSQCSLDCLSRVMVALFLDAKDVTNFTPERQARLLDELYARDVLIEDAK